MSRPGSWHDALARQLPPGIDRVPVDPSELPGSLPHLEQPGHDLFLLDLDDPWGFRGPIFGR